MKSSLIVKINLQIVLAVALCAFLLGIVEFFLVKKRLEDSFSTTLNEVGQRLGTSLVMPVWNIDDVVVEAIITTEMLDRDILAVAVRDVLPDQYLYFKARNEQWDVVDIAEAADLEGLTDLDRRGTSRTMEVPLQFNGKTIGTVVVYVTDRFLLEQLIGVVTRLVIRIAMLLGLMIAILVVAVNRIVTRPLKNLSNICRKVAYGDFDLEMDTTRKDEIGSLATSFAYMRDAVKEKINSLNEEIQVRTKSEADLQSLRSYLGNIVDSMPSILVGVDKKCAVIQWNLEAEKVTSIPKIKAMGKSLTHVFPCMAGHIDKIKASIGECVARKETRVILEINGVQRISDITIYPLFTNGAEGAVIRLDDVADRVRMEEVMVQTEKMMTVGGLAAGMAHEINNPLAGIMQSVQVIQNRFSLDLAKNHEVAGICGISMDNMQQYLQQRGVLKMLTSILESGNRAARIIDNMLSFSRKSSSRYIPCNIPRLLDKTVELAANDYDLKKKYDFRRIEIVRDYGADLAEVRCDANTIQQVFLNILKNAAQAMVPVEGTGGSGQAATGPRICLRVYNDQAHVKVEIEDNGPGMDASIQKRIFEPFFTTKDIGEGTGLGLSVSFFIIKENHKGTIEVASTPGKGTTFTIGLPLEAASI